MKKLTNYLMIAALAVGLFTSCADDETTDKSPSLNFKGGAEYVSSDVTLTVGEAFTIGLTGAPNASTNAKLTRLSVVATMDNIPETLVDEDLDKATSLDYDLELSAPEVVGTARIVIELTDNDGEMAQLIINITTEEGALDLKAYSAVLMGAQNASEGSTASLFTGEVFTISNDNAKNNSELVDVVYYFGAKDAAIYSPSNSDIQSVTAYDIASWATKNGTKLSATSLTSAEFEAIETNYDLEDAGTPSDDVVGLLSVDDVIVFETADGKKGVFKVDAIVAEASGSITINVKVEQ